MKTTNTIFLGIVYLLLIIACTKAEKATEKAPQATLAPSSQVQPTKATKPQKEKTIIPGLFPEASQGPLQKAELVKLSADTLRLMRNEIFARHGYRFRSADMQKHFEQEDWYQPQFDQVDAKLNDIEKDNIALINRLEKLKKGELPQKEGFDFYYAMFPQLSFPFELMTENRSPHDGSLIPEYLNQTGHDFNLVVGKVWKSEQAIALIIHEETPNPPSFAPHQFQLFTFTPTGDIIDSLVIAYDDFDGYQTAIVEKNRFETQVFSYEFGEEEGPNGLPEVDSVYQVRSATYEIEKDGKISLIK